MSIPIRVLICDDHEVVRLGLKACLAFDPDVEIVGFAKDGFEAVERYREMRPDVLLMDVRMPGMDGPEAAQRIIAEFGDAKILMLTAFEAEEDARTALRAGVLGYFLKSATPGELNGAIRAVATGRRAFSPEIGSRLPEILLEHDLSERQLEVLGWLAKGLTNAEIAGLLGISANGVKAHLKNIFEKLDVADRTEAVALALRRGILR